MIRYIKSEIYRIRYNRALLYAVLILTAAAASFVGILTFFRREEGFAYGNTRFALSNEYTGMGILFFIVIFLSAFIDGNEKKQQTMKHSVAYGIKRSTIYYGRILVQAVVCTIVFLAINAVFVLLSYGMLEHSQEGELLLLLKSMVGGMPLFLSVLAVNYCFLINLDNSSAALAYTLVLMVFLPVVLSYLGRKVDLVAQIAYFMPYNLAAVSFGENHEITASWNTSLGTLHCYLSGLGITILSSVIGAQLFQKKEIK